MCIATETARCSKEVMVDCAAGWVANVLPLIQRHEPLPIQLSAIELLKVVFSSATDMPEFTRQVCTPNVPKFSLALISLCENVKSSTDLRITGMHTLADSIKLYPNAHRSLQASLNTLCLPHLGGGFPTPTPPALAWAAATLFASLPTTGGKVAAADVWKKSMLGAVRGAFDSFSTLTATSDSPSLYAVIANLDTLAFPPFPEDPLYAIPVALDRLRSMTALICALLRAPLVRPVPVPVAVIVQLSQVMIQANSHTSAKTVYDPAQRSLELAILPEIWKLGCEVISVLARCVRHHIAPHVSRLLRSLVIQIDRLQYEASVSPFLETVHVLLTCAPITTASQPDRILKVALSYLKLILESPPSIHHGINNENGAKTKPGGKKRSRIAYEGDEVFRPQEDRINVELVLKATPILSDVILNPSIDMSLRSLTVKMLISILLRLGDLKLTELEKGKIWHAVWLALKGEWLDKGGLGGLPVNLSSNPCNSERAVFASESVTMDFERLVHPRLPPLLKNVPMIELIALTNAGDKEGMDLRDDLGLNVAEAREDHIVQLPASAMSTPGDPFPRSSHTTQPIVPQSLAAESVALPEPARVEVPPTTSSFLPSISRALSGRSFVPSQDGEPMDLSVSQAPSVAEAGAFLGITSSPLGARPLGLSATTEGDPLSSSASEPVHSAASLSKGKQKAVEPTTAVLTRRCEDDSDDELMPTINLESDTDEEE